MRLPPGESIEGADDPNGGGTCDYLAAWQDVLDRISITRPGRPLRLMGVQGQKLTGVDLRRSSRSSAGYPARLLDLKPVI